jgi:septal ring factor EnvC (AmiA/AmiB activator)
MSLYGNNETLYKRVGDEIRGGDAIAVVGNSGGNTDSGLYFELRHQGKPLDPLSWVKVR